MNSIKRFILGRVTFDTALEIIEKHPTKRRFYTSITGIQSHKFVAFIMKNPDCRYYKWDSSSQNFVFADDKSL